MSPRQRRIAVWLFLATVAALQLAAIFYDQVIVLVCAVQVLGAYSLLEISKQLRRIEITQLETAIRSLSTARPRTGASSHVTYILECVGPGCPNIGRVWELDAEIVDGLFVPPHRRCAACGTEPAIRDALFETEEATS